MARPPRWYREKYVYELHCNKCGHDWLKRHKKAAYPTSCPRCKQPKYWEEKKRKT
jgi:predicted Zn-ribbon and HTH transcriptional regulator